MFTPKRPGRPRIMQEISWLILFSSQKVGEMLAPAWVCSADKARREFPAYSGLGGRTTHLWHRYGIEES
jgi:hypothetical protein